MKESQVWTRYERLSEHSHDHVTSTNAGTQITKMIIL
jgi:hypothetical protein